MTEVYLADAANLPDPATDRAICEKLGRDRAEKIRSLACAEDRIRSLAAGLLLTKVFSRYGLDSEEIFFGENGKPLHEKIKFNLSHSGSTAALAVSEQGEVGCDLERLRRIPERLAQRLPAAEKYLEKFLGKERERAFFRLWTMRESYLKMTGEGIRGIWSLGLLPEENVAQASKQAYFREYQVEGYALCVCSEENHFGALTEIAIR